jgi:hypothetical protein
VSKPHFQKANGLGRFGSACGTRGDAAKARVPRRAAKGDVGWLPVDSPEPGLPSHYVVRTDGSVEFALVERVGKHEY